MSQATAYRGSLFYFKDSATLDTVPIKKEKGSSATCDYVYIEDGVLIVEAGIIKQVGPYSDLKNTILAMEQVNYGNQLITPGFIDTHQHATQSGIVAAYGEKLLEWLNDYVFPGESNYSDATYAKKEIDFFINHLLRNGTTTAVSYGPLFYEAADMLFDEVAKRKMRFITGNILMDKNSPDSLKLGTQENYDISRKLIEKWHHKDRLSFCISPRFALACSEELMELCGVLKNEFPDLYIQTHLDENIAEISEVKNEFPWSKHYLDVYDHFGLITDRTILGHCIHLTDDELNRIKETNAIISWCPVSNNFLGSGLFDLERVQKYTHNITLGTDWGGGNTLSMFAVMDDAYKVAMLKSYKLPSMQRWYMATLGAAKSLQLDDKIGNFTPGKEADFIVIDPSVSPFLKYRLDAVDNIFELLFILMTLGDEKIIRATYILGELAYKA